MPILITSVGGAPVTNEQWARYMPYHEYPASEANTPVSDVPYWQVLGYINWLNQQTEHTHYLFLPNGTPPLPPDRLFGLGTDNAFRVTRVFTNHTPDPTAGELGVAREHLKYHEANIVILQATIAGLEAQVKHYKAELIKRTFGEAGSPEDEGALVNLGEAALGDEKG
jgi:hypothetical protein